MLITQMIPYAYNTDISYNEIYPPPPPPTTPTPPPTHTPDQNVYHARTQAWKIPPFRGLWVRKIPFFQPKSLILKSNKTLLFQCKRDFIFII